MWWVVGGSVVVVLAVGYAFILRWDAAVCAGNHDEDDLP